MRRETATEFLKREFEHDYLVDPLLPAGGLGIIHGKGGHGKTQLAFTLIGEVLRGGTLFGRYPVDKGRVLFFQFDMPEQLFQERLRKAATTYEHPDDLEVVTYHKTVDIFNSTDRAKISRQIEESAPELVIFDTLRKLHPYDENDNAVPSQVYGLVHEMCDPVGAAALVIHHDRKSYLTAGDSEEDAAESFRGARAWVDDSDLGVRLRKRAKGEQVLMDFSKLRCAEQSNLLLRMNPETLLLDARQPETAREWGMHLMSQRPGIDKVALVEGIMTAGGVGRTAAYNAAKELLGEG